MGNHTHRGVGEVTTPTTGIRAPHVTMNRRINCFLLLIILFYMFRTSSSISFHLEPDSKKCLRDEVHKNVLVVGNYELEEATSVKTNIEVGD